jgi:sterol desaturase/sphingolipid hydroxylase (fatty acid hydroxylase superfamily)
MSDLLESLLLLFRQMRHALLMSAVLFVVVFGLELVQGADRRRYLSRHFANDVLYMLFYYGGLYNLLFLAPLLAFLQPRLSVFKLGVLDGIPAPAWIKYVLYWLIVDALGYWQHRLQHHNRLLWAFHSVHHTQTQPTLLTTFRNHILDQLCSAVLMATPLLMIGVPPSVWLPFYVFQYFSEMAQHSQLRWSYGGLYGVVVSPLFHSFHHSAEPSHYNRNFGKILSIWDFVFGTAVSGPRPRRYGVDGLDVPETLSGQFLSPFRILLAARRPATATNS